MLFGDDDGEGRCLSRPGARLRGILAVIAALLLPGCSSDPGGEAPAGACTTGPETPVFLETEPQCNCPYPADVFCSTAFPFQGPARLGSAGTDRFHYNDSEGSWRIGFHVEDASICIHLALAPQVSFPFEPGDEVLAFVDFQQGWWPTEEVLLRDLDGHLLLHVWRKELVLEDLPAPCPTAGGACGPVAYPTLTFRHPDDPENPQAPSVSLRHGQTSTLSWNGRGYRVVVGEAWVYTRRDCIDEPAGWQNVSILRSN
jgi:hypothetical protein